jgi:3-hydroxy-9,10-secoandrosta-1,3,5(10)-triene-9,17-dione monooxygenase reductase component
MPTTIENNDERRRLRNALGRFPTGVAIATTLSASKQPVGMTINSLVSISLAPALLAWSIDRGSASYDVFTHAKSFAVTVLAQAQESIAIRFATRGAEKFAGLEVDFSEAPVIPNACAWFKCETCQSIPLGDHALLVGRIIEYETSTLPPLVFLGGQFQHTAASVTDMSRAAA